VIVSVSIVIVSGSIVIVFLLNFFNFGTFLDEFNVLVIEELALGT